MSNPGPNVVSSSMEIVTPKTPDGMVVGKTATELVGFHGKASAQASNVPLVATTASTATTPVGFTTTTQANAIVTAVNSILTALINKGIIAGS